MRLIDADVLLKKVKEAINQYAKHRDILRLCSDVKDAVMKAPTIEAEPLKHGRWVDHGVRDWRCSECGEKIHKVRHVDGYCYDDKPNYCPNCGAKMGSAEDGKE